MHSHVCMVVYYVGDRFPVIMPIIIVLSLLHGMVHAWGREINACMHDHACRKKNGEQNWHVIIMP